MTKREHAAGPEDDEKGPPLPDSGAMVDEHGRRPGVPSRTGTGSSSPPADADRVERAVREARNGDPERRATAGDVHDPE
ncbi:hypothetical protein ACIRO3_26650 [Streptomyces sp. NPDC102278]|uniref:hypothetical protein n=1 Tax=Streptomyces sp. NPDC102278 TaxID=3366152 RepID=UPI003805C24C